ncbi:MAG TPA: hypothetical protein VNG29_03525 [Candidatus Paceibacterota bacterium]|nr:hypothetical protein [Candidatus Paceibacterota bacterium]
MISITTTDDKTIACDAKNIQVAIGGGPTTIVIEKKDWSDSFITYADNITIYVRTKEQRDAWQKTLGAITAKFYAPRDVLPEDAKTP